MDQITEQPSKYDNTIFKSAYFYGKTLHQFFLNYGYGGHLSFSIVLRRGTSTFIHNLTKDETVPIAKAFLSRLNEQQLHECGLIKIGGK